MQMTGSCGQCKFWDRWDLVDGKPTLKGECKRYPPRPEEGVVCDIWPTTELNDVCGEFQPEEPYVETD